MVGEGAKGSHRTLSGRWNVTPLHLRQARSLESIRMRSVVFRLRV